MKQDYPESERKASCLPAGIRDIEEADADDFAGLLVQLSRETSHALMTERESLALATTQRQRTRQLVLADNQKVLLALQDDHLVGFLGLTQGLFERNRHSAALTLGVLADCWGRGIASRLLEQALVWADERGIRRIEVEVADSNERAIRLYRRFGFRHEGTRVAALSINGASVDLRVMACVKP